MKRLFIESEGFKKRIDDLKDKNLLKTIEDEIIENPQLGVVVSGTGGIKKIRVAKTGKGKSGSYRVFYLDISEKGITHLMYLLLKGEKENISDKEKKILKHLVENLKKASVKVKKTKDN